MLSLATIEKYLSYAATSQYLAADENERNKVLQWGEYSGDKRIPFLLYQLHTVVSWARQYYVGQPKLDLVANYMYSLCGRYLNQAKMYQSANSAGTVTVTPTTHLSTVTFPQIQFRIGVTNSFMAEGDTVLFIDDTGISDGSLRITVDGVMAPVGLDDVLSYTAVYEFSGVTVTFNQAAQPNQVYIIDYEKISL